MREIQDWVLAALKEGLRYKILYLLADNITRAHYADFLWPKNTVRFRAHFMFHTDKSFNGFSSGEKLTQPHGNVRHCCWCGDQPQCAAVRILN